jgi:hypothetical protein
MIMVKTATDRMAASVSIPASNAGASGTKLRARQNKMLRRTITMKAVGGELLNHAASGVWYKPLQCFRIDNN